MSAEAAVPKASIAIQTVDRMFKISPLGPKSQLTSIILRSRFKANCPDAILVFLRKSRVCLEPHQSVKMSNHQSFLGPILLLVIRGVQSRPVASGHRVEASNKGRRSRLDQDPRTWFHYHLKPVKFCSRLDGYLNGQRQYIPCAVDAYNGAVVTEPL